MEMKLKIDLKWEVNRDGTVKVKCMFYGKDRTIVEKYLEVHNPKYHWVVIRDPITGEEIGEDLFIDDGYVILEDKEETYVAWNVPPLVYRENEPTEMRWK